MNTSLMFGKAGDERVTPDTFFALLDAEFQFDIDCAANELNHKCATWFGPGGVEADALTADWGGLVCWLNPPYSLTDAFLAKAREEADKGATVVILLPARTDTKYWHRWVWDKLAHTAEQLENALRGRQLLIDLPPDGNWRPGVRGRFIQGRLAFELRLLPGQRADILAWKDDSLMNAAGSLGIARKELAESVATMANIPASAVERIWRGKADDQLLDSAPFPSVLLIFTKAGA